MKPESTQALKGRLSNKYIGRAGIHGIGVGLDEDCETVFVYAVEDGPQQQAMLEKIRDDARTRRVILRREQRPALK